MCTRAPPAARACLANAKENARPPFRHPGMTKWRSGCAGVCHPPIPRPASSASPCRPGEARPRPVARRHLGPASTPLKRRGRRSSPPPSRVGPPLPSPVSLPLLDPPGSPPGHISPTKNQTYNHQKKGRPCCYCCCCCFRAGVGRGSGGAAVVALAQGRKPFFFSFIPCRSRAGARRVRAPTPQRR